MREPESPTAPTREPAPGLVLAPHADRLYRAARGGIAFVMRLAFRR